MPGKRGLRRVRRHGETLLVASPDRLLADAFADPLPAGGLRGLRALAEGWLRDDRGDPEKVIALLDLSGQRAPFRRLGYVLVLVGQEKSHLPSRGEFLLEACRERRGRGRAMLVPRGKHRGGRFEPRWGLVLNDPAAPVHRVGCETGAADREDGGPEPSGEATCRESDPAGVVAVPAVPSPGEIGSLVPATLAARAAKDRRAFERLCADLLLLDARESGDLRRFALPDEIDRSDRGIDAFFDLGPGAARGPLLGPGRTVVQVKCRDPLRGSRVVFGEVRRGALESLGKACAFLGRFERFLLVTNLVLSPGGRRKLEWELEERAGTAIRDDGDRTPPPEIRVVGAVELCSLLRLRPHLLGHFGDEPDLRPWRTLLRELVVPIGRRQLLPTFRGREEEIRRLRSLLGIPGGDPHPGPLVLLAPREAGTTRLVFEALRDVAPRAFWWRGEPRSLERILRSSLPGGLWVVVDPLPRGPGDPAEWSALVRDHQGARLVLVTSRPRDVPGATVLELPELDPGAMDALAAEMVENLECLRRGPGEGFRWRRALALRSHGLPGRLVRMARRLGAARTAREREEILAMVALSPPPGGGEEPTSRERPLAGLVALVGGIRTGSGLPAAPPPPELAALADVAGLPVGEARARLLELADRRAGIRPVPGGVEPAIGVRDFLVRDAIGRHPDLVHRALADPVLRARAAEGLGRLRGDREAVRFGRAIVREMQAAVRAGSPLTETNLAVLAALVFVVPGEVVSVVRALVDVVEPARLAGGARRKVVETLADALHRAESVLDALPLLERLAVAENEPWANNATGLFRDVFDPGNVLVPLSLRERLAHLQGMARSGDPAHLRLLLSILPVVFRPAIGGRPLPAPEHWLPDLAPPVTRDEANRYRRGVLKTWGNAIRTAAAIVGPEEAVETFRDTFPGMLVAAVAGNCLPLARGACRLVSDLSRAGILREEDPAWLAVLEEWRQWRQAWAGEERGLEEVLRRVDVAVGRLREALFPPGRRVPPFVEAKRWLGPVVPWAAVGAGRDRRPEGAARKLVRAYVQDPFVLGEAETDWLVSREALHSHLFWRRLGERTGPDRRVVDLLTPRLEREQGPEALGAFLRGAARREERRAGKILGEVIDRCLADPSLAAPADVLLRVLHARGLSEVEPGEIARVLRGARGISRKVRGVFLDPALVSALASLPPGFLEEIARRFGGPGGAPVRLSCLEALVLAAGEAGDTEERKERVKAAWRVAGDLPAGLTEVERARWRRIFPRLVPLDPRPLVPWLRARLRRGEGRGESPGIGDDLADVRELLERMDRDVPGLVPNLLDALHEGSFLPGIFELLRWIDPRRHGEELIAWARSRGDRRAWLLAAGAVDLYREGGLDLAARLVERCEDKRVRGAVARELCATVVTGAGFLEGIERRLQDLRDRAAALAATGSSAAARALGRDLARVAGEELEESRTRYRDTWLDWDGTLGELSEEDFLGLPPEAPARRRWAVRVLESLRDRDVLARLTEEDIRLAIEEGQVRDEVAQRWRGWLERRRGRS